LRWNVEKKRKKLKPLKRPERGLKERRNKMKYYEFKEECDKRGLDMVQLLDKDDALWDTFITDDDETAIALLDKATQ